jgi:hypothetical protein
VSWSQPLLVALHALLALAFSLKELLVMPVAYTTIQLGYGFDYLPGR